MLKRFNFCPRAPNCFTVRLPSPESDWTALEGTGVRFCRVCRCRPDGIFVTFCRVFVESLKTLFTGGGPFPAKCTCTQEHFGAPPFWLIIS